MPRLGIDVGKRMRRLSEKLGNQLEDLFNRKEGSCAARGRRSGFPPKILRSPSTPAPGLGDGNCSPVKVR